MKTVVEKKRWEKLHYQVSKTYKPSVIKLNVVISTRIGKEVNGTE